MQKIPCEILKEWFQKQKRDLPWRNAPSPYAVWISEIMLQQTQVAVVMKYFQRWMHRFPSVKALASAPLEEVLKVWEGLGYYSRARNLHAAAKYFVEKHDGDIPADAEALRKVKGLGPYTIGAILSFAFHQKRAAVDANVTRVLARFFCLRENIGSAPVQKKIWALAEEILPEKEPWLVVEGLIELGATICTARPKCYQCPLNAGCKAYLNQMQSELPIKTKNAAVTLLQRDVMVIYFEDEFLLRKGEPGQVMADLYEFPYCEKMEDLASYVHSQFAFPLVFEGELKKQSHSFTRYRAELFPTVWKALEKKPSRDYHWIPWEKMQSLPFSSGHRRIFEIVKKGKK